MAQTSPQARFSSVLLTTALDPTRELCSQFLSKVRPTLNPSPPLVYFGCIVLTIHSALYLSTGDALLFFFNFLQIPCPGELRLIRQAG